MRTHRGSFLLLLDQTSHGYNDWRVNVLAFTYTSMQALIHLNEYSVIYLQINGD